MRIIGGIWANRQLVSPAGRVRPTAEAIREAMIGMLAPEEIKGARVLDLFAGTGALGLEALSRGAKRCDFIENGPAAIHALKANVAALRQTKWTRVFDRDAIPFVERLPADAYDIAFADPPYGSMKLNRVIARWQQVPFCRVLLLEHAPDHPDLPRGMTRQFGDSAVTMLRAARTNAGQ
jgi:16S rRNA (guanine966-N2)-methyltransferase